MDANPFDRFHSSLKSDPYLFSSVVRVVWIGSIPAREPSHLALITMAARTRFSSLWNGWILLVAAVVIVPTASLGQKLTFVDKTQALRLQQSDGILYWIFPEFGQAKSLIARKSAGGGGVRVIYEPRLGGSLSVASELAFDKTSVYWVRQRSSSA